MSIKSLPSFEMTKPLKKGLTSVYVNATQHIAKIKTLNTSYPLKVQFTLAQKHGTFQCMGSIYNIMLINTPKNM